MCSPEVYAKVQQEITRRRMLGGITGIAVGGAMLHGLNATAAQDASPVASPEAVPAIPDVPVHLPAGLTTVLDLTYTLSPDFPVWPGNPPFSITNIATVANDGFFANDIAFTEHTGTHMDAPAHFIADGLTVDLVPVQQLIAPLVVIDISAAAAADPDAGVTVDDITAWEAANGPLPDGAFVAMFSNWGAKVGDPAAFVNLDTDDVQHYPGFTPDASAFLVSERNISGAGVDTLSLDPGNSTDFASHVNFLGASKFGVENLANLEQIPTTGAYIFVGAPKTLGGSGGPARAIAVW